MEIISPRQVIIEDMNGAWYRANVCDIKKYKSMDIWSENDVVPWLKEPCKHNEPPLRDLQLPTLEEARRDLPICRNKKSSSEEAILEEKDINGIEEISSEEYQKLSDVHPLGLDHLRKGEELPPDTEVLQHIDDTPEETPEPSGGEEKEQEEEPSPVPRYMTRAQAKKQLVVSMLRVVDGMRDTSPELSSEVQDKYDKLVSLCDYNRELYVHNEPCFIY